MKFEKPTLEKISDEEVNNKNLQENTEDAEMNLDNVDKLEDIEGVDAGKKENFFRRTINKTKEIFSGKPKTEEQQYEEEMKNLKKLIRSLVTTTSFSVDLGASFGGSAIDFSLAKTPAIKEKLNEIVAVNKELSKMPRGREKVEKTKEKMALIRELGSIGKKEIEDMFNRAA